MEKFTEQIKLVVRNKGLLGYAVYETYTRPNEQYEWGLTTWCDLRNRLVDIITKISYVSNENLGLFPDLHNSTITVGLFTAGESRITEFLRGLDITIEINGGVKNG